MQQYSGFNILSLAFGTILYFNVYALYIILYFCFNWHSFQYEQNQTMSNICLLFAFPFESFYFVFLAYAIIGIKIFS